MFLPRPSIHALQADWDGAALTELARLSPRAPAVIAEIVEMFLARCRHSVGRMQEAAIKGRIDRVAFLARHLEADSMSLGAMRFAGLCGDLADCLNSPGNRARRTRRLLSAVDRELALVEVVLWTWLSEVLPIN